MVRPWVEISLSQYQELKRLTEKKGKPLSQIIRKAVSEFLKKKDFPAGTAISYFPKGTRNRYKSVSAYFPRSDWSLLGDISKETGRCKTHLVREAVDEYLGGPQFKAKEKGKQATMMADSRIYSCPRLQRQQIPK